MVNTFKIIAEIEMLVTQAPTTIALNRFSDLVKNNNVALAHAFELIKDIRWMNPLSDEGYFKNVPTLEQCADGTTKACKWPQAIYLERMASETDPNIQKKVMEIILDAGVTDNYWVHHQFTEVALKLPVGLSALWALHESQWLRKGNKTYGILERGLGSLVSKLALEGQSASALELATALLEIRPDPKSEEKLINEGDITSRLEPAIRCDRFNYEHVLKENIPDLVQVLPDETLSMLCHLLQKAIEYSIKKNIEESMGIDFSPVWRPAIEDHAQNQDFHISCPLIVAVRDAAEKICRNTPSELPGLLQSLEARRWAVFKRIALYLLTQAESSPLDLVRERLVNEENFESTSIHHEYFHLMRKHYGRLLPEDKQLILEWIKEARKYKEHLATYEPELAGELREKRIQWWQYKKLIPIQEYLEGEWKDRFEAMAKELGPDHQADFHFWMSGWKSGPTSPVSVQKLAEMPMEELTDYLKSWKPPKEDLLADEVMAPTPEGLGRELIKLVVDEPERYAAVIDKFMDPTMDRTYVRHLIHGFNDALKAKKAIPYEEVLALCQWVVDQPVGDEEAEDRHYDQFDQDLTWRYSRQAIGDLVEQFFLQGGNPPIELKDRIWAVIAPLTSDSEPDVAYEAKYGRENMDFYTLSINTTRGKALHAMMHYALWVMRTIEKDKSSKPVLEHMPEIRNVWEAHLTGENCPFYRFETDHAVFGYWMPLLNHLDRDWTARMIPSVLPSKLEHYNLRHAAWDTFITYSQSNLGPTYGLLRDIYFEEIRVLEGKVFKRDDHRIPGFRLAEQVAVLYAIGKVSRDEGDLLDLFFSTAHAALTAHIMSYIGRSMTGKPHENQEELVAQFKTLWEWRVNKCGGMENVPSAELAAFGWWFRAGKFGDDWALENLEKVLRFTGMGDLTFHVIEQMKETIGPCPMETLRCFKRIVEWWDDYWSLSPRKEAAAWQILDLALGHENLEVRTLADEIINLLGSKGMLEYGKLLKMHEQ